jgi:GNAT superfamily N-acetyltransferase
MVGVVIAKCERHKLASRGYIAMLAVQADYRGQGIGTVSLDLLSQIATRLVEKAITAMRVKGADEVSSHLPTSRTNSSVDLLGDRDF